MRGTEMVQVESATAEAGVGRRVYPVTVREVIAETPDAVSIVFDPPTDGTADFAYAPGQFLTVRIPSEVTGSEPRCYSLSSAPDVDPYPAITVKRTAAGYASNWLCDHARPAMILDALAPAGTFTPTVWDRDLVLIAAGSGITPMMSIISTALRMHSMNVTLIYANRDARSQIFAHRLSTLEAEYPDRFTVHRWLESEQGLPTADGLTSPIAGVMDHEVYICGPTPFMDIAQVGLDALGVPAQHIHRELFYSLTTNPFAVAPATTAVGDDTGDTIEASVSVDGEQHTVTWPRTTVLLDVLLDAGIDAPYVCREGTCGGCEYTLVDGEVRMLENHTLDDHDLRRGARLACQSLPVSDAVTADFD